MKIWAYVVAGTFFAAVYLWLEPILTLPALGRGLGLASLTLSLSGAFFGNVLRQLRELEDLEITLPLGRATLAALTRDRKKRLHVKLGVVIVSGVVSSLIGWFGDGFKAGAEKRMLAIGFFLLGVGLWGMAMLILEHYALENRLGDLKQSIEEQKRRRKLVRELRGFEESDTKNSGE